MKNETWKIIDLLNTTADFLRSKGIDAPRTSTEILLAHTLNMKRLDLYLNFDKPVDPVEINSFRNLIKRRTNKEPVQYILGEIEFMSLPFKINKNVLIPRPETEILVEFIVEQYKDCESELYILDIGTGSGNIAVSLAKYLENPRIIATDIWEKILEIAKENAKLNDVDNIIKFKMESIFDVDEKEYSSFDLIVSNPPYISKEDYKNIQAEVRDFEPDDSVCDNSDGLKYYREIIPKSKKWLSKNGALFFEIGYDQKEKVIEILESEDFKEIKAYKDYAKLDRIITAKI
ncbi:peptide chain release factor N(5)-glutamine methyltransferase [candidate division KSB1 bacterium]